MDKGLPDTKPFAPFEWMLAMRYLRASLSEVAIWDRALTATERTSVIRALGTKWGITVP